MHRIEMLGQGTKHPFAAQPLQDPHPPVEQDCAPQDSQPPTQSTPQDSSAPQLVQGIVSPITESIMTGAAPIDSPMIVSCIGIGDAGWIVAGVW